MNRKQLRRQMRCVLRLNRRTLTEIADRYDTPPVHIEEAIKAVNIAEATPPDRDWETVW